MTKYHISPETQRPNICRAQTIESCPLKSDDGGTVKHFDNKVDARKYLEGKFTEEHGETTTLNKKPKTVQENTGAALRKDSTNNNHNEKDYSAIKVEGYPDFNAATDEPQDFDKVYADVSTRLAEAHFQQERANQRIQQKFNKKQYNSSTRKAEYVEDQGKIIAEVRQRTDLNAADKQLVKNWEKANEESLKNAVLKTKIDQAFRARGGWNRAYLVPDGHLHKSMDCSTCNKGQTPTKFEFMTDQSGKDEEAIVKAAGYRACTTCYPTAPIGDASTLPTTMLTQEEKERAKEQAEKKAALSVKKADAATKAPTAHGGTLTIKERGRNTELKTERAASQWYVSEIADGYSLSEQQAVEHKESRYKILYNLALKNDKSMKDMKEELDKKIEAKSKRDYKENVKHAKMLQELNKHTGNDFSITGYEEPVYDTYDVPDELMSKSPREWVDADKYIPED